MKMLTLVLVTMMSLCAPTKRDGAPVCILFLGDSRMVGVIADQDNEPMAGVGILRNGAYRDSAIERDYQGANGYGTPVTPTLKHLARLNRSRSFCGIKAAKMSVTAKGFIDDELSKLAVKIDAAKKAGVVFGGAVLMFGVNEGLLHLDSNLATFTNDVSVLVDKLRELTEVKDLPCVIDRITDYGPLVTYQPEGERMYTLDLRVVGMVDSLPKAIENLAVSDRLRPSFFGIPFHYNNKGNERFSEFAAKYLVKTSQSTE